MCKKGYWRKNWIKRKRGRKEEKKVHEGGTRGRSKRQGKKAQGEEEPKKKKIFIIILNIVKKKFMIHTPSSLNLSHRPLPLSHQPPSNNNDVTTNNVIKVKQHDVQRSAESEKDHTETFRQTLLVPPSPSLPSLLLPRLPTPFLLLRGERRRGRKGREGEGGEEDNEALLFCLFRNRGHSRQGVWGW